MRGRRTHDSGSVTPLAIGFTAIALALIALVTIITDIYLAHRNLYALADSAALAAADSFAPGHGTRPGIVLTDDSVRHAAQDYLDRAAAHRFDDLVIESPTGSPDGRSAEVTLTATARPVLLSPFVPSGIPLHAHSSVRGTLRLD